MDLEEITRQFHTFAWSLFTLNTVRIQVVRLSALMWCFRLVPPLWLSSSCLACFLNEILPAASLILGEFFSKFLLKRLAYCIPSHTFYSLFVWTFHLHPHVGKLHLDSLASESIPGFMFASCFGTLISTVYTNEKPLFSKTMRQTPKNFNFTSETRHLLPNSSNVTYVLDTINLKGGYALSGG